MSKLKIKKLNFKIDKINIIFLIIFLFLIGIYFLSQKSNNNPDKINIELISPEKIDKIEMINNDFNTILIKNEGTWFVSTNEEQKEANIDLVDDLMDILSTRIELEKVSSKSEKYNLYELDESQITQLKIYQGEKLIQELGIGKMGSIYPSTFIKLKDDSSIYQANNFLTFLVKSPDWIRLEEEISSEIELEQ